MRALIKTMLRASLIPLLRILAPVSENIARIKGFILLSSRISYPLDSSVVVLGAPEVRGTGNVRFGRNVLLYPGLYLETQHDAVLEIGDNVVMSRGVHIAARANITIGAGTMIGEYTSIRDANHLRDETGAMRDGAHFSAPITIGRQVWIGRGVTVLPGISIGDDATVGANAVVTRDVAPGVTVVGVPASPIRSSSKQDRKINGSTSHPPSTESFDANALGRGLRASEATFPGDANLDRRPAAARTTNPQSA